METNVYSIAYNGIVLGIIFKYVHSVSVYIQTFITYTLFYLVLNHVIVRSNTFKSKLYKYTQLRNQIDIDNGFIFYIPSYKILFKDRVYIHLENNNSDITVTIYSTKYYLDKFIKKINKIELIENSEENEIYIWNAANESCNGFDHIIKKVTNIYTDEQKIIIKRVSLMYNLLNTTALTFISRNIKFILCGQSGVGKSELGYIIALTFKAHLSITNFSTLIKSPKYINVLKKSIGHRSNGFIVLLVNEFDIAFDNFTKEQINYILDDFNNYEKIIFIFTTNKNKSRIYSDYPIYTREGRFDIIYDLEEMGKDSFKNFIKQIYVELKYKDFDKINFNTLPDTFKIKPSKITNLIKYNINKGEDVIFSEIESLININSKKKYHNGCASIMFVTILFITAFVMLYTM